MKRGVLADAVDVERALQLPARDQRHGDERLGLDRRARDEAHARVEVRLVREHGLAVVDRPAGDALAEREALAHDLVRPLAAREDGEQLALRLVRLVDVDVLVRDELGERVGDPLEQGVEALLGEHVVEDLGEAPVRLGTSRVVTRLIWAEASGRWAQGRTCRLGSHRTMRGIGLRVPLRRSGRDGERRMPAVRCSGG